MGFFVDLVSVGGTALRSPHPEEPLLLSISDLARRLGVTTDTLNNWTAKIPGFPQPRRIGKRPYFLLEEVLTWLREQPSCGRAVHATH